LADNVLNNSLKGIKMKKIILTTLAICAITLSAITAQATDGPAVDNCFEVSTARFNKCIELAISRKGQILCVEHYNDALFECGMSGDDANAVADDLLMQLFNGKKI
jgi:hypothetical protein